ncbi:MAG: CvpA family protein [Oscillospiraceae bacterium]|nr:CvpA family protein [Oscillospiraceae bacterium]
MWILVDLVIVLLIALFAFVGYKRGLIKASIGILAFFIAIIIALVLYRPVAGFLMNNTGIGNSVQGRLVSSILPEGTDPDDPVIIEDNVGGIVRNTVSDAYETTVNTFASALAVQIVEIIVLLVIFMIVKFALRFVTVLTDIVTGLPILKQFDKARRHCIWLSTRCSYGIYHSCDILYYRTYAE